MDDTYVNNKKRLYSSKFNKRKKYTKKNIGANINNALDLQSGGTGKAPAESGVWKSIKNRVNASVVWKSIKTRVTDCVNDYKDIREASTCIMSCSLEAILRIMLEDAGNKNLPKISLTNLRHLNKIRRAKNKIEKFTIFVKNKDIQANIYSKSTNNDNDISLILKKNIEKKKIRLLLVITFIYYKYKSLPAPAKSSLIYNLKKIYESLYLHKTKTIDYVKIYEEIFTFIKNILPLINKQDIDTTDDLIIKLYNYIINISDDENRKIRALQDKRDIEQQRYERLQKQKELEKKSIIQISNIKISEYQGQNNVERITTLFKELHDNIVEYQEINKLAYKNEKIEVYRTQLTKIIDVLALIKELLDNIILTENEKLIIKRKYDTQFSNEYSNNIEMKFGISKMLEYYIKIQDFFKDATDITNARSKTANYHKIYINETQKRDTEMQELQQQQHKEQQKRQQDELQRQQDELQQQQHKEQQQRQQEQQQQQQAEQLRQQDQQNKYKLELLMQQQAYEQETRKLKLAHDTKMTAI